ncbi:hypothetical protein SRABI27_03024 [Pedobacter sp. Bi27]|uniref:hypothetical protein n=1 Tax=unclassified Pedobacter TaxID=2628915 RepID=UPI001D9F7A56|nr:MULTISPECIES: hypothetical protein [unclassified Pedobacter]CAH0138675.1 hypothetical protein SRABI36_00488 [Pedobacter sp. Bi36]CAH0194425.1 hypothetical protein SRABI126_01582 [Pedobacter sp. Bi126]CAH0253494.1 hypothetical protein SRABI27_03024 [Pedobacter sp. Bi27]
MKRILKYLGVIAMGAVVFSSCKKEGENIFNMFDDVTVTYHSTSPYAVTDYKEVNAGDSVYLDYTISSAKEDMYAVCIFETSAAIPSKIILNDNQRRNYSGVVKLKMNTRVGKTSYRIWALDKAGVYLGDGYKTVTIEVRSDYKYWSSRELYIPDTLGKVKNCYMSLSTGELFNYSNGAASSDKIDLGLYRSPVTGTPNSYFYNVYALNSSPIPFTPYDISTWTKKATLFAAPKTAQSAAFLNLRTGDQIITAGKSAKPTLKGISTGLIAGSLFYFLTAEGKYGAFYVNSVSSNNASGGVFLNVDVKIQN